MQDKIIRKPVWLMLSCFLLLSVVVLQNVTFAKWQSGIEGSTQAKIAAFAVSATPVTSGDVAIDYGTSARSVSYEFKVGNQKSGKTAEVAIKYSVNVVLPEALPSWLSMKLDGITGTVSEDGKTYSFEAAAWAFAAGAAETHDHTLTFTATNESLTDDFVLDDIAVTVTASQLD